MSIPAAAMNAFINIMRLIVPRTKEVNMSKLGPKCQKCQEFTLWQGVLIGGTQVFGCPNCGLLYYEVKKSEPVVKREGSLFRSLSFGGSK